MVQITAKTFVKRRDNIPWKKIEKEGVLLNLTTGDYFTVNESGFFIWKSLNGNRGLAQIAHSISLRYNINKDMTLIDIIKFVKVLNRKELVTICDSKRD